MADCFVSSIRRGDVPCVETVLRTTAERENARAVERAVAVYERLMTDQLDASPADSVQAFIAAHEHSEAEALTMFTRLIMFDTDASSRHQLDVSCSAVTVLSASSSLLWLVAWSSGSALVFGRCAFAVLRSTCS